MPDIGSPFFVVLIALAIDAIVGDPPWLWRRLPHPVVVFGHLIGWLDRQLNRETATAPVRRAWGFAAIALIVAAAVAAGATISLATSHLPFGFVIEALLASTLIAQKSLYDHVRRVADALASEGLAGGRRAVSMIVGRDPDSLDEAGVARAAIESTAENFSDGIVAPVFCFVLLGLPGLVAYKAINTADSMIGHRSPRHLAFGFAAAKLDDLVNLVPARLSGLVIAVAAALMGRRGWDGLGVMWRDARKHASPNAGWPEAAMAGSLGIQLAGPRLYGGRLSSDLPINAGGRRDLDWRDIWSALRIYTAACLVNAAIALAASAALS